jgi:hypothetical protein
VRLLPRILLVSALTVGGITLGANRVSQPAEAALVTARIKATTTTSTAAPLVQNMVKPPLHDPDLDRRMASFFTGLRDYNNAECDKAFLPMPYYVALKQGGGNEADWRTRLIGHYHEQLAQLRARFRTVLPGSIYNGYVIKSATAHTVRVGSEQNKAPYWQVYMTTMAFKDKNGQSHNFVINTMISFRGSWYVVHVIGYG